MQTECPARAFAKTRRFRTPTMTIRSKVMPSSNSLEPLPYPEYLAGMAKLADGDFKKLIRSWRTPAGAAALRKAVYAHHAAGGPMDAAHYEVLFNTYMKYNNKNSAVGLLDKKPEPKFLALVDECFSTIRGPKGKRFLTGTGKAGWSRLGVLTTLGEVFLFLGRYADACEVFEHARKTVGLTGLTTVLYMRAAARSKDRELLENALQAFEKVKNEAYEYKREYEKNKKLVKTLKSASGKAAAPKKPTTPAGKIAEVIRVLGEKKGKITSFDGDTHSKPKPMAAAKLAKLVLPNGEPPSEAMRAWLAFDATWVPLFDKKGGWDVTPLMKGRVDMMKLPAGVKKDTPAIELPGSASQDHLLAFGKKPKKGGDYPVLGYEKGEFWVKFPTFADFVSEYFLLED